MSFLSKIGGWVKHSAIAVSDTFAKLVGHDKATEFGHAALDMLKTDLGVIAVDAVEAVQTLDPNAPGEQKKAAAFSKIVADASAKGIQTEKSIVSLLIELAVGVLKGHYAPAGAAAAAPAAS